MNHPKKSLCCFIAILTTCVSSAYSEESLENDKMLDASSKQTEKLEVGSSLVGYRDTLVFYTFKKQKAVLRVLIDNKSKKFPVAAQLYVFEDSVSEDGLKKWLNNQHSDGLFPDVPEPVATHKIPADSCNLKSQKLIDHSKESFGEYDNYSVTFKISGVKEIGDFSIKDFTDKATVHLKTE